MNESSWDFADKSNRMILAVEDGLNEDLVSLLFTSFFTLTMTEAESCAAV